MSRERLRRALSNRSGPAAVVPLIEAHAAHLEQLGPETWLVDPESHARMHRNAQRLHGTDAVTLGAGGLAISIAAHVAASPSLGALGARAAALAGAPLSRRPAATAVAETPVVSLFRDVMRRLKPVLGDRAGVTVVLPQARLLAAQLGIHDELGWADDVLAEVVRALGAEEPDLFLLVGDEAADHSVLESLVEFFGASLFPLSRDAPRGLAVSTVEEFLGPRPVLADAWLYTTRSEIPEAADPSLVSRAIAHLHGGV